MRHQKLLCFFLLDHNWQFPKQILTLCALLRCEDVICVFKIQLKSFELLKATKSNLYSAGLHVVF